MEQQQDHKQSWDELLKKDPNEGRAVAMKFTLDGEKLIYREGGKDVLKDLPELPFAGLTEEWKTNRHGKAMGMIDHLINLIKTKYPQRELPLMRSELIHFGVDKKTIKHLEDFGLIRQRIVKVLDDKNGNKSVGGRSIVYFTQQGHAYMKIIKEKLHVAKTTSSESDTNNVGERDEQNGS